MKQRMKMNAKRSIKKKVVVLLIAGFFVLLFGLHFIMKNMGLNQAERACDQTINFTKSKLETYDNYLSNDRTKSLVRLMDKVTAFTEILKQTPKSEKALDQFANEQRIQGMIVLDKDMNIVSQTTGDGDTFEIWKDLLQNDSVEEIIECPQKVYMTRVEKEYGTYDVAVVARKDAPGVILGYMKQDTVKEGVNDITLNDTFDGMLMDYNGLVMVSRGNTFLASNKKIPKDILPEDLKKFCKKSISVKGNLKKLKYNGNDWYIREANYQDYTIHIMMPVHAVYRTYYLMITAVILAYIFLCIFLEGVSFYKDKKSVSKLKKYYDIIEAENQIYVGTLLVNLHNGIAEWIKIPDTKEVRIGDLSEAGETFQLIADKYVEYPYKEAYLKFTDVRTVRDRLSKKKILSFMYEDKLGCWMNIGIVPQHINETGMIDSVLYLISDVTDEMKKEKEYQQKLKIMGDAKTNFLRRMSHDIRTPINGMNGIIEIAQKNSNDPQIQSDCLKKIKTASGYLLTLVNDILDMSKLESGEIKLDHKAFHLTELLDKMNQITRMQCVECGLGFHVENYDISHERLIGSPKHLQRILMNFASNAVKYNKERGEIFVSTREIRCTEKMAEYEFICRDTGVGMSEEYQKKIFEPFTQENNSSRTTYSGTGLGMPIAKELAELMGGSIELKSQLGEGTTFTLHLAFEIDNSEPMEEPRQKNLEHVVDGRRILLVEDNELNMEVAEYLLKEKGALITKAWDGQEALDIFSQSEEGFFDLVLMDIMMPKMGGWEATRRIRSLKRRDAATVPIVAMSANAFQDDIEHSKKAGMNAHVTKPLEMNVLLETIEKILNKDQQ